jgi:hypothetical protein
MYHYVEEQLTGWRLHQLTYSIVLPVICVRIQTTMLRSCLGSTSARQSHRNLQKNKQIHKDRKDLKKTLALKRWRCTSLHVIRETAFVHSNTHVSPFQTETIRINHRENQLIYNTEQKKKKIKYSFLMHKMRQDLARKQSREENTKPCNRQTQWKYIIICLMAISPDRMSSFIATSPVHLFWGSRRSHLGRFSPNVEVDNHKLKEGHIKWRTYNPLSTAVKLLTWIKRDWNPLLQ